MSYTIVPRGVSARSATVWIATERRVPANRVRVRVANQELPVNEWRSWSYESGNVALYHSTLTVTGLNPRSREIVELVVRNRVRARAEITTLPERLPGGTDDPFRVLLGSCFCSAKDPGHSVQTAFKNLPVARRPELKLLCGDQVYLDSPWSRFLWNTHRRAELERLFFDNYRRTWVGDAREAGLNVLLAAGANYFTSDDHELWNNAPNRASVIRDSWTSDGRRNWMAAGTSLYETFQTPDRHSRIDIPPLSIFVADTRMRRDADEHRFMEDVDLAELSRWVRDLRGPGVLVLGQPLLADRKSWRLAGHLGDWGLADYDQYSDLVRALAPSRHSIVLLTGDVHFRRIASTRLNDRAELIEIISSPMILVDSKAKGSWRRAPARYPAFHVDPSVPQRRVTTRDEPPALRSNHDHFFTLEFRDVGGMVNLEVYDWPVPSVGRGVVQPVFAYHRLQ